MAQYINKDDLTKEIERRIKGLEDSHADTIAGYAGEISGLKRLISFLNALEVKKVDLDFTKEVDVWISDNGDTNGFFNVQKLAKHFFELGLKAQQNINIDITNIDKVIEENGVDPNSKEAKIFKESYYIALEKLKYRKENNHDTRRKALKGS